MQNEQLAMARMELWTMSRNVNQVIFFGVGLSRPIKSVAGHQRTLAYKTLFEEEPEEQDEKPVQPSTSVREEETTERKMRPGRDTSVQLTSRTEDLPQEPMLPGTQTADATLSFLPRMYGGQNDEDTGTRKKVHPKF